MNRTRTLLIVQASKVAVANAAAVAVAGPKAANTFSVPVCHGGSSVPTHYAACWSMEPKHLTNLKTSLATEIQGNQVHVFEKAGRAKLNSEGYKRPSNISSPEKEKIT